MKKICLPIILFLANCPLFAQDITSNLVSHFKLDGTTTDAIGSNNGINTGAKPTTDRFNKDSGAYYFNGLSKIAMGDKSDFQMGIQDFTISVWFKQQHTSSYYAYIVGKRGWSGSSSDKVYSLLMTPSNEVLFYYRFDDNSTLSHPKSKPLDSTNWHHAVISVDRSDSAKLYIDNKFVSSVNISSKSSLGFNCTSGEFMLGNCTNRNEPLVGSIDDVRVYKGRALSAKDVDSLFAQKPTSINSTTDLYNLQISPNPTSDKVRLVHAGELYNCNYSIYNNMGTELMNGNIFSNNQVLSLTNLTPGIYHISCKDSNGNIVAQKKIVRL